MEEDEEKSSSNYFSPTTKNKASMDGSRVDWTNLPHQLPPLIADRLQTHLEHLRFRSVCSSWRSSIPRFQSSNHPRFPFPLSQGPAAFLSHTTVYLLRPDPDPNANRSASSSSTSSFKGWLLKLEESSGKIRLLNPITSSRIGYLNDGVPVNPMDLNLLDFNMVALTRSCVLRYTDGSGSIFGINKGRPYLVDKWGQIFCIDSSSLELVPFSPPIGLGHRKNLVECCGELCVVDRYLDHQGSNSREGGFDSVYYNFFQRYRRLRHRFYEAGQLKVVDFRVYKLLEDGDEGLGRRWVEVKSLGEQALFLTVDCCFSVLAAELEGCKGNCIYFTNSNDIGLAFRELVRPDGSVFSMEDHSIEGLGSSPLYSKMFWPIPT
ncbi:hypothetical protein ACFX14_026745 [Malus domestica]